MILMMKERLNLGCAHTQLCLCGNEIIKIGASHLGLVVVGEQESRGLELTASGDFWTGWASCGTF